MPAEDNAHLVKKPLQTTDERRRDALRRLGKVAAYSVPATLSLMSVRRAAADS
ncbi:hypothetical protein EV667_0353 [Ancylobacter aquaticus]|uniref:Uncharacterized protein n=1 Tax=Ancylobacter aquaticus TaxID=100 RepID=A0A4R1I8V1_ANCAQ|nr:hypothetical protein [Ancylobacter aquaticus]TCK30265.1 hypothetical protein EV667_0353 [Ancylobacter aquaticus]